MGVCFQAEVVDPVFEFSFFFPVSPLWSVPPSSPHKLASVLALGGVEIWAKGAVEKVQKGVSPFLRTHHHPFDLTEIVSSFGFPSASGSAGLQCLYLPSVVFVLGALSASPRHYYYCISL